MSDDFQNKLRHVYMGLGHILAELERNKIKIKVRGGFLLMESIRNHSKNCWSCMRMNYVHLLSQFGPVYFGEHRQS
jgi:hypothetical protein